MNTFNVTMGMQPPYSSTTRMSRLFPDRSLVKDPWVLLREELPPKDFKFVTDIRIGDFYLVIPRIAKEVFLLQMLGKNIDVFLPSTGEGLLVRCKAIDYLYHPVLSD